MSVSHGVDLHSVSSYGCFSVLEAVVKKKALQPDCLGSNTSPTTQSQNDLGQFFCVIWLLQLYDGNHDQSPQGVNDVHL